MHCVRLPLNLRPASVVLVSSPQKDRVIVDQRGKGMIGSALHLYWHAMFPPILCSTRSLMLPVYAVFHVHRHSGDTENDGICYVVLNVGRISPGFYSMWPCGSFRKSLRPKNTLISNKAPLDRRRGICDHSVPHWVNTQGVALECREQ